MKVAKPSTMPLENPRPEVAESTLTENAASPFHAEPKQGGAGAWRECQSGVWLAPTLLGGTTWGAEARDQVAAGSREREQVGAGRGRASGHGFFPTQPGTIHIELRQAQVRIEGNADPALVRVSLECLRA
jgi:hypothetical protein